MSGTSCFHCGLPVPEGAAFAALVLGEQRKLCCRGCQAVAQAIVDNGLEDYYRHRTAMPVTGREIIPAELQKLTLYDHPEIQRSFVLEQAEHLREASLILEGITCAACVWLNERHLMQLPGVQAVSVNYATHRARVSWDESRIQLSRILVEIQALGYNAHPFDAKNQEGLRKKERAQDLRRIAVAGLSAAQVMTLSVALYAGDPTTLSENVANMLRWASLVLTLPVVFYAALPFYRSAWRALSTRQANMDVPVTLALLTAFVGSCWVTWSGRGVVYFDAVSMFALFLLTTRFLERGAREKSAEAAENLLKLAPAFATRLDGDEQNLVPVVELRVGDLVLSKPGEAVAADGEVMEGRSTVDEALMTGESRPVGKQPGAAVIAGSVNLEGPLKIRVTGVGEGTVLAGIVRLLDRALAEKPQLAQMADRVAGRFTWALLAFTAIVGLVWAAIAPERVFEVCLSVLVVTCPCALSLAAPAAFAAAGSRLLKQGILVTRGHALEALAKVNRVVFDKTGTLTKGRPELVRVTALALDRERVLTLAASLEQASEHPLAVSFLAQVDRQDLDKVEHPDNTPGRGVSGVIDGLKYWLGNRNWMTDCGLEVPAVEGDGTLVWLFDEKRALAVFELADGLRQGAAAAVEDLRQQGLATTILSGDGEAAVARAASDLGIVDWRSGLKPADKLAALKTMQDKGDVVLMLGDGVNDAPVLAGADVSLAMGGGTQVARASSDIVLLNENLRDTALAVRAGRDCVTIMKQNFGWAIVYNLVALPVAALGWVPPWLAALGMSLSSLVVVMNALRLRSSEGI